jgi:hypothetical protein
MARERYQTQSGQPTIYGRQAAPATAMLAVANRVRRQRTADHVASDRVQRNLVDDPRQ